MDPTEANQSSGGAGPKSEEEAEDHATEVSATRPKAEEDEGSHHGDRDISWACI